MSSMRRGTASRALAISLLMAALVAAGLASIARADGDPASDYLVANQVFLTSQSESVSAPERQLLASVRAANRAGFQIRVAVISTDYDLGSITGLWRKPRIYAEFLGIELSGVYKQRLLVVMPNGFGFNWPGHPTAADYRLLAGLRVNQGANGTSLAAQAAVRRLAAAAGVRLATTHPATPGASGGSGGFDPLALVAAAMAVLVAIAVVIVVRKARRPRRSAPEHAAPEVSTVTGPAAGIEARPAASRRALAIGVRWRIPGLVLLGAVAVAAPILALRRGASRSGGSTVSAASIVTPPPFSWPAGRRPAPGFALRDQNGRPVSIEAYRGRPVIVTFIDPLCRNLCPLEAQVLNQTLRQMPASHRPAIVAVSVDVYADSRADLLQDVGEWDLVPQWRWAVGSPAKLGAVWKRYGIGVQVTTKRIAGTTINYITHTEAAYIIDATGHERALFMWPFYPQDVKRVLGQIK
jgi:cytochrome oxidase Cu insertion factor (SCO1/SenC/PrrC family)